MNNKEEIVKRYTNAAVNYEIVCLEYANANKTLGKKDLKTLRKSLREKKRKMISAKKDMEYFFRQEAKEFVYKRFKERMSR